MPRDRLILSVLIILILAVSIISSVTLKSMNSSGINNVGDKSNTNLVTYYVDVVAVSNDKVEPVPGACVELRICIPSGPCTQSFRSITDSQGRVSFPIDIQSNYTQLVQEANLNQPPPVLKVDVYIGTPSGENEYLGIIVPTKMVLNSFYLKINMSWDLYSISDDVVYLNNVKLYYNDASDAFVLPPNTTPTNVPATTISKVTAITVTNTITSTTVSTVTSTYTLTLSKVTTLISTATIPRTEYVTSFITLYRTKTLTSYSTKTLTLTVTKPVTSTVTITSFGSKVTKVITSSITVTITSTKSILKTLPPSTITLIKTLTKYVGSVSKGPSLLTIIISVTLVFASIVALLASRPRR